MHPNFIFLKSSQLNDSKVTTANRKIFFSVAELMCYLNEVYHQTIPCSKQQLPPLQIMETAHSSGTKDFFLNLGPLWLESYWFTVILEPFSCYWLTII